MIKNRENKIKKITKNIKFILCVIICFISGILIRYIISNKSSKSTTKSAQNELKSPTPLINDRNYKYETLEQIKSLFEKLGIEYSNHSKFHEDCIIFKTAKKSDFLLYDKNPEYYDKLMNKYDEYVAEGYVAPIYIKWVNDKIGYGCFANVDIPEGNLISEYVGEIIPKNKIASKIWSWKYPSMGEFSSKFPKKISLNCFRYANETRFVNHGSDPNCKTLFIYTDGAWRLLYVAKRFIKKDEEILVNYGKIYWRKRKLIN